MNQSPPGGDLAVGGREGYGDRRVTSRQEPSTWPGHFTRAQSLSLLAASILGVLREGSGAASNVTLGERSLRRRYAGANMCRVRQEGVHSQNHPKDTSESKAWSKPLGVTKGKGCALRDQETLFPSDHSRPTSDSIYLAQKIDAKWKSHRLTPAALQKLVDRYGDQAVEDKLRELYGFPPEEAVRSPFAYLSTMLRMSL